MRVIVWQTKDVTVFMDQAELCNDLFLSGEYGEKTLETDTHWRCRNVGSFNWRWKFPIMLPLDEEDEKAQYFKMQMWDRDIAKTNDQIGEYTLNISQNTNLFKK